MSDIGNKKIFARNLMNYIERSGRTQKELSLAWDVPTSTINNWVMGKTYPRMGKIELMANYFGILKSDLIEDKSTQEKKAKTDVAVDIVFRLGDDEVFCDAVKLLYQLKREQIEAVIPVLRSLLN